MSVTPNSGFLGQVKNLAGPHTELQASEMKARRVDAMRVDANDVVVSTGGYTRATVVAFAPANVFASAAAGPYTLLNKAGQPAPAASTDADVVTLPAGAIIDRISVDNNGTALVGGTSIAITVGAFNGAASITPMAATANAVVTSTRGAEVSGFSTDVGAAGVAPVAASLVPASPNNFLNMLTVGVNSAGDLRVVVDYYILG